jgi:sporulation protein YlmC with PRC-barrel domain
MRYRLTLLEQMHVVREDGKDLGRLMDVRARAEHGPIARADFVPIDALLIGAAGWFERLGLKDGGSREVQPQAVIAVERERIVVRGEARESHRARGRPSGGPRKTKGTRAR